MAIKIGDIEQTLPHGMFLHKSLSKVKHQSVVKLTETNSYIQRKNQVVEQADLIREERKKMQTKVMLEQANKKIRTSGMSVPKYI